MTHINFILLLSLTTVSPISVTPVFDGYNCPGIGNSGNATIPYLQVLPGYGFDALSNLPMGQVFSHNYSTCKVTRNGKYLIPDSVSVTPVKENHYQFYAELFEHWSSYTSLTSSKINMDLPIFGLFSEEKQMIKKKQDLFNSVVRTAFRNKAYEVRQDIISELHPDFKSRVYEIAAYEQNNDTKLAAYYSEKLVSDYGTHYVTAVDAGALIVKLDCLSKSYIDRTTTQRIASAAALSFPFYEQIINAVNLHLDVAGVYSQEHTNGYRRNVQKLDIFTMGGAPFTPNFNFSTWLRDIPYNMVAIERYGKRLHNAISLSLFPELLMTTTRKVSRYVEAAIEKYININEKQIRTQLGGRQQTLIFNQKLIGGQPQDNGRTTKVFGGIYQTCKKTNEECQPVINKLVGLGSPGRCPLGYMAIPLYVRNYTSEGNEIFWCGALNSTSVHDKGFLFGGFHSYLRDNPLTGDKSCHPYFDDTNLLWNNILRICLSSDHKNAQAKAVGFGGFFSCQHGNPFALPSDANTPEYYSLVNLPRTCPTGYSQYLMTTFDDCNIHACLEDDNFYLNTLKFPLDPLTANDDIQVEDNAQSNVLQVKGPGGTILSRNIKGRWEFSFDSTCQFKTHIISNNHYKKAKKHF